VAGESDRFSYVRVVREVEPTVELEQFLARVAAHGIEYLGDKNSTLVRVPAPLHEQLQAGYEPKFVRVGIPAATVHRPDNTRATLFERRLPRSQRANSYLRRLQERFMKLDLDSIGPLSATDVHSARTEDYIIETTSPERAKYEREFSLILQDGPVARQIRLQHEALYGLASQHRSLPNELIADPTIVPILTVPAHSDGQAVNELVEQVNQEATFGSLVNLRFYGPEVNAKIR